MHMLPKTHGNIYLISSRSDVFKYSVCSIDLRNLCHIMFFFYSPSTG